MKHLIVTLFPLVFCTTLLAYNAEIDGIYYNFSGDEATVISWPLDGGKTYSGSIVIPESVVYNEKSYNVTSIGMQAFRGCSGLISVNIPDSVTSIGGGAFRGCSCLNTINMGTNVERIYRDAFIGTPWYDNLPDGMVYVGKVAYKYKGEMPEGTHYSVKEGISSISEDAFWGCSGLTSITIPESVTRIEEYTFYECPNLVSVNLPENMTSIEGYAFFHCSTLSFINIPKGVTRIGSHAFSKCSSLASFNIPEGSRGIEKAAFAGCSNLKTVVIPESVIYIEWFGFSGCTGLSSIVCNAKNPPSVGQFGFDGVDKQNCKLYVLKGCEEAYRNAEEWQNFNIIEMGTGIGEVKSEDPLTPFRGNEKCEDAVYDLSGRKVNFQFSTFNSQFRKKGLYIQNGKKVVKM